MENPIEVDDLGRNPLFSETSIFLGIHKFLKQIHLRCHAWHDIWPTASKSDPPIQMTWWLRKCLQQELGALPIRHWTCFWCFGPIFFCPTLGLFESSLEMILDYTVSPPFPHHPWIVKVSSLDFRNRFSVETVSDIEILTRGFGVPKPAFVQVTANWILSLMFFHHFPSEVPKKRIQTPLKEAFLFPPPGRSRIAAFILHCADWQSARWELRCHPKARSLDGYPNGAAAGWYELSKKKQGLYTSVETTVSLNQSWQGNGYR